MRKIIENPTAAELRALNKLYGYPKVGRNVGGGKHAEIPADWRERIARGEEVPGVSVHRVTGPARERLLELDEDLPERAIRPKERQKLSAAERSSLDAAVARSKVPPKPVED